MDDKNKTISGFTIVELLVVIVVIGVLAAITIVSYSGIRNRAVIASLQSDLSNAATQFKMFHVDNGYYPATISTDCASSPTTTTNICLKPSAGNSYTTVAYSNPTPQSFILTEVNGSNVWRIKENLGPVAYTPLVCPSGFIVVPGSPTYGTDDFCVMKYEAKNAGGNIPVSVAGGTPWVGISQSNAIAYASNVAGCVGCHLITEAEWMTIAQNVLSVPSNWSTGVVGSGFIYSGHNDNTPSSILAADTVDSNGYLGTMDSANSNQKRTLILSNGEVIWDLSGNVYEWTSGTVSGGQPGVIGNAYTSFIDWGSVTTPGSLPVDISPAGTGISGANSWTSATNGIGRILTNTADTTLRGIHRGGDRNNAGIAGVLSAIMSESPSYLTPFLGFRVSM